MAQKDWILDQIYEKINGIHVSRITKREIVKILELMYFYACQDPTMKDVTDAMVQLNSELLRPYKPTNKQKETFLDLVLEFSQD
jgi:hypothetical protein